MTEEFIDRWDSDAFKNKSLAKKIELDLKKNLIIIPHPFVGWRSAPNQSLDTIKINENGLRSKSKSDVKFKRNAILLGGSTAWGFGASSNEFTPAYLIEDILYKKFQIELNIINLSDQMFSSFEELTAFINNVNQINPTLVIFLSGTNDINREISDSYKINSLYEKVINFSIWGQNTGIIDEKNYLKKIIKHILRGLKKLDSIPESFYTIKKPKKNDITHTLIREKFDFVNSYCKFKNIKCAHFLQPDLHFKKNKSESEVNYLNSNFNKEKSDLIVKKFYSIKNEFYNKKESGFVFEDLLDIFEEDNSSIFFDRVHVTDKGYIRIAETISKTLANNFSNEIKIC